MPSSIIDPITRAVVASTRKCFSGDRREKERDEAGATDVSFRRCEARDTKQEERPGRDAGLENELWYPLLSVRSARCVCTLPAGHSPSNQLRYAQAQARAVWSRSFERDKTRTRDEIRAFFNGRCADPRCILPASRSRGKQDSRGGRGTLRSLRLLRGFYGYAKVPEGLSALERFGVSAIIVQ